MSAVTHTWWPSELSGAEGTSKSHTFVLFCLSLLRIPWLPLTVPLGFFLEGGGVVRVPKGSSLERGVVKVP